MSVKVAVYNQTGKKIEDLELNEAVFGVKINESLVHQVYLALEANARQPWANTKDKGEVRGGGKKPWKQKGTGRARHGSIRSPLWKGGGVTFGPLNTRNYKQKINKKMNQTAVKSCFLDKALNEKMIVLDSLVSDGKTKQMAELRNKLPGLGKTTLLLNSKDDEKLNLATRNIQKLDMQRIADVNVVDMMHHQYIIITKEGLKKLEKRLS
jgi:large subunit ribosomal protein L4